MKNQQTIKSETAYGTTVSSDGKTVTIQSTTDSVADALIRKSTQLRALVTALHIERTNAQNGDETMADELFDSALWLASDLATEVSLLARVA